MNIPAILKQPSTILGIAGVISTISATVAHVLTHDTTITLAAGVIAGSIVHIAMPDNTGAQSSIEKLVTDAVTAAAQKRLAAAMPMLVQDGLAVMASFTAPAAPVTVTTTTVAAPAAAPVTA